MALQREIIPLDTSTSELNPRLSLQGTPFVIPPWPSRLPAGDAALVG